jgi:hypothetical protein
MGTGLRHEMYLARMVCVGIYRHGHDGEARSLPEEVEIADVNSGIFPGRWRIEVVGHPHAFRIRDRQVELTVRRQERINLAVRPTTQSRSAFASRVRKFHRGG